MRLGSIITRDEDPQFPWPWEVAAKRFEQVCRDLDVDENASTWSTQLIPVPTDDVQRTCRVLLDNKEEANGEWIVAVGETATGSKFVMAFEGAPRRPCGSALSPDDRDVFHDAGVVAHERPADPRARFDCCDNLCAGQFIGAATLTRSLIESVAALDYDARKVRAGWVEAKAAGPVRLGDSGYLDQGANFRKLMRELTFGSKFTDNAPELAASWRAERVNVMTQIKHLARRHAQVNLHNAYEMLCNVPVDGNRAGVLFERLDAQDEDERRLVLDGGPEAGSPR